MNKVGFLIDAVMFGNANLVFMLLIADSWLGISGHCPVDRKPVDA